jgi:hypothetical protein
MQNCESEQTAEKRQQGIVQDHKQEGISIDF